MTVPVEVDVLVVGAGQAGLGVGYWLRKRTGLSAVIVDAAPRLGHSWRQRWDSLVLFTPRRFSALPGGRFPRGPSAYPTKNETADYLDAYASEHDLPVRLDTRVQQLVQDGVGFVATTSRGAIRARAVVLAPGPYISPYIPAAGAALDPDVQQLHSGEYRRPTDVTSPDVVVVGGGNSAAQLAVELATTHHVTVVASRPMWFLPAAILGASLYWWIYLTGILNSPADSRVSKLVRQRGDGIIGRELQHLVTAGRVRMLTSRVVAAEDSMLILADKSTVSAGSVLWCTGFRPDFGWLDVPGALDGQGRPVHLAGQSPIPGVHWVGLPWQTRLNSGILDGVDRDARAVVDRLRRSADCHALRSATDPSGAMTFPGGPTR